MDVLIILVFVSLVLVTGGLIFLFKSIRSGDYEHGDRLSLLPLEEDDEPGSSPGNADRKGVKRRRKL